MNTFHFCLVVLAFVGCSVSAQNTTLPPCPEANECVKELQNAMEMGNLTNACSEFEKSSHCFASLNKTCPQRATMFEAAQIRLDDDEFKAGCEGACAQAITGCLGDMVSVVNSKDPYTLKSCKKVMTSLKCLENLKAAQCKGAIKTAIVYIAKFTKEQEFRDLCDENGNPSKCFKDFDACSTNLAGTNDKTPTKVACKKIETYLECTDGLNCKDELKKVAKKLDTKLEGLETKYKCATEGTCSQRMAQCARSTMAALNQIKNAKKNKDKLCEDLDAGITCMDTVRNDKTCVLKKALIEKQEAAAMKLSAEGKCGAASVIISTALLAMGSAISIFKNYF